MEIYTEVTNKLIKNKEDEKNNSYKYNSWEEWYHIFKISASHFNIQLTIDDSGFSFLDFMEHEPLKRAYQDGVDPELLAKSFAVQFDITKSINSTLKMS